MRKECATIGPDNGECDIHNSLRLIHHSGGMEFSATFRNHMIKGSLFGDLIDVDEEGVETKKGKKFHFRFSG